MITTWTKAVLFLGSLAVSLLLWYGLVSLLDFISKAIAMLVTGR